MKITASNRKSLEDIGLANIFDSSPAIAMMNDPDLAQLSNKMLDHLRNKYESGV